MSDHAMHPGDVGVDRRTMIKRAAVGGGLTVAALATPGLTGVANAAGGGKRVVLDVDTNGFADFQSTNDDGTGAFYVSGAILWPGTSKNIGRFQCWGFISAQEPFDGVVNQEFDVNGRGKILIAGIESDAARGVTGGTGHFANARGQGWPDLALFDFGNTGKFRIAFRLTGAAGPPIT